MSADSWAEAGIDHRRFVQANQSRSSHRTLRGLHLRAGPGEAKVVRCARGRMFDVVVDLRPRSPEFGRWERFLLDDEDHVQVYVPPGCGHGFQVLSDICDVCYLHDRYYEPALDVAVAWDDEDLAVAWPLPDPILSERDRTAPSLEAMLPRLREWFGGPP